MSARRRRQPTPSSIKASDGTGVRYAKRPSVCRRLFSMIDHQNFDGPLGRLKLQPGLVLQRLKDRRREILRDLTGRRARIYRGKRQTDRVLTGTTGCVDHVAAEKTGQLASQFAHST